MEKLKIDFSHSAPNCKLLKNLELTEADKSAYDALSRYHYRRDNAVPFTKIFAIFDRSSAALINGTPAAVIVYSMPTLGSQLRTIATKGKFLTGDRQTNAKLVNENIRRISRVIVEPRYRGLGLAEAIVAGTLDHAGAPVVEAMSVMSKFAAFFERAGMIRYDAPISTAAKRTKEVLNFVGVDDNLLIDPQAVYEQICGMDDDKQHLVYNQISRFIQSYGRSGKNLQGEKLIEFVLIRLFSRPAYYIWHKRK